MPNSPLLPTAILSDGRDAGRADCQYRCHNGRVTERSEAPGSADESLTVIVVQQMFGTEHTSNSALNQ